MAQKAGREQRCGMAGYGETILTQGERVKTMANPLSQTLSPVGRGLLRQPPKKGGGAHVSKYVQRNSDRLIRRGEKQSGI